MERMKRNYQLRRQHRHLLLNGEMGIEDKKKIRKEKEAKKKVENKDKKGQKGSVFADLCRFICINKKKIVILRAFCDIAKLHMNS